MRDVQELARDVVLDDLVAARALGLDVNLRLGAWLAVADLDGEILIEHTRPAPGVTYLGNGRPAAKHPDSDETSPKS